MKRLAPEIDRLMWLVAEGRDPRAISEFEQRYPELRMELSNRIAMLSGLRMSGKKVVRRDIPRFRPTVQRPSRQIGRGWYVLAAAALGAVAFASYSFTVLNSRPVTKIPTVNSVRVDPPKPPEDSRVVYKRPELVPPITSDGGTAPSSTEQLPNAVTNNPMQKLVTVHADDLPLASALQLVGSSAGLRIELAPGMENDLVFLDYTGVPVSQVLEDLGSRYNFTAFPQENNHVLIIPARREPGRPSVVSTTPTAPSTSGSGSDGGTGGGVNPNTVKPETGSQGDR